MLSDLTKRFVLGDLEGSLCGRDVISLRRGRLLCLESGFWFGYDVFMGVGFDICRNKTQVLHGESVGEFKNRKRIIFWRPYLLMICWANPEYPRMRLDLIKNDKRWIFTSSSSHVTIEQHPVSRHRRRRHRHAVMATGGMLSLCLINAARPRRGSCIDHSGRD